MKNKAVTSDCGDIFAADEAGALHKDGIIKKELFVEILNQHLMTSATEWLFYLNNDLKHFQIILKMGLKDKKKKRAVNCYYFL